MLQSPKLKTYQILIHPRNKDPNSSPISSQNLKKINHKAHSKNKNRVRTRICMIWLEWLLIMEEQNMVITILISKHNQGNGWISMIVMLDYLILKIWSKNGSEELQKLLMKSSIGL